LVTAGWNHCLALTDDGQVFSWGSNDFGQLGREGRTRQPILISTLSHLNCSLIAAGEAHSLVATNTGQVYSFGKNSEGQLGLSDFVDRQKPSLVSSIAGNVVKIACGAKHSLVLSDIGELFATGSHNRGQLGLGDGIQKVNKFQEGKIMKLRRD